MTKRPNPGHGPSFSYVDEQEVSHQVDLVPLLERSLQRFGYAAQSLQYLLFVENALAVVPRIVNVSADATRTMTEVVMQTTATNGKWTDFFEIQRGLRLGRADIVEVIQESFDLWVQTDLVVLLDALKDTPEHCMMMEMGAPAGAMGNKHAFKRRILFGPVHIFSASGSGYQNEINTRKNSNSDAFTHEFCTCCLLMNTLIDIPEVLFPEKVQQLKLIASRMGPQASADFRINFQDYLPGKAALERYTQTWVGQGLEMRKQMVLVLPV